MLTDIGLHQITTLTQAMQIPLIFLIAVLFYKARKVLLQDELFWISLGFFSNLIYLICYILLDKNSPFNILTLRNSNTNLFLQIFSTITSLCFYFSLIDQAVNNKKKQRYLKYFVLVVSIMIIYYPNLKSTSNLLSFGNFPSIIFDFFSLGFIMIFFKLRDCSKVERLYLNAGFGLWAFLQLFLIASPNSANFQIIEITGFVGSLVAKALILMGMSFLYVNKAKTSALEIATVQLEKENFLKSSTEFENILRNTFHEITIPLNSMAMVLTNLNQFVSKDGKPIYQLAENNFERIRAIITVAKGSYRKDALFVEEYQDLINNNVLPSYPELKFVRINTLIEYAIQSFRKSYKEIIFECEYGGNCIIECKPIEIIQVFINLFKNSYEAPNNNLEKIIHVKTSIEKVLGSNKKYVIVEVKDNGTGIPSDIINLVWERRFTTKKEDQFNLVRGEGLYVVKSIIQGYEECSIEIESPIKQGEINSISGTKFILKFRQYQINK